PRHLRLHLRSPRRLQPRPRQRRRRPTIPGRRDNSAAAIGAPVIAPCGPCRGAGRSGRYPSEFPYETAERPPFFPLPGSALTQVLSRAVSSTPAMTHDAQNLALDRQGAHGGLIDPFGRAITYLRVSVTDRCDFRCVYCMSENMTFLP